MKANPNYLFLSAFLLCKSVFSQSDVSGIGLGHLRTSNAFYVGWTPGLGSIPGTLDVRNDFNDNINFFTGTTVAQRMTILGAPGFNQGFVGIGGLLTNPQWRLDVQDNTNITNNYNSVAGAPNGYRINGDKLLSHPGISNTFVGKNAGAGWVFPGPGSFQGCTFVGEDAVTI